MGLKGCWERFKGTSDTKQLALATVWCCSHLLFLIPLFRRRRFVSVSHLIPLCSVNFNGFYPRFVWWRGRGGGRVVGG